jgi:hypothetical protein
LAAVFPSRWTDPDLLLEAGDFERALEQIAAFREREGENVSLVVDLPPDSVPDICALAARGVLDFFNPMLDSSGSPYVPTAHGIPVRVYGGIFGIGASYRIAPDGSLRLQYSATQHKPPEATWGNVRNTPFSQLVVEGLFGPRGLWHTTLERLANLDEKVLSCPAWPFHLERCGAKARPRPSLPVL